ncbi:urea ABC transporter permease subunit UrtB [Azospirillum sp. RWY-5-1]|uniref:Urea ABC transporter permease subunit UrtB n=1 Tax=Azospirillum oleiclasticum TaxID=2735135 RepID=A0ABX2TG34_9PROT|nr:urea ABC transporter permease subunit UrtB [Azospirillum oleiclasticum]NYZ14430.1 urea ABC transporter permease subunit UrtB [Azospirillum oleiclasticum]NYZ23218.1 urea ABC transporter permease subunit UrtB [Azospirillum oleiclasticum]
MSERPRHRPPPWRQLAHALLALAALLAAPARADESYGRDAVVRHLCEAKSEPMAQAIGALLTAVAAGREEAAWGARIVAALDGKRLLCAPAGPRLLRDGAVLRDPVTGREAVAPDRLPNAPFVNLRTRAWVEVATAALALFAEPGGAAASAQVAVLEKQYAIVPETALAALVERQPAPDLRDRLLLVRALQSLEAPSADARVSAIATIAGDPTARNRTLLAALAARPDYAADPAVRAALDTAMAHIDTWLRVGEVGAVLFSGLSYASILFMAALGLAVIFGLMGVINLAQGELIMIGAYATWLVQEALRALAPALLDWYLLLAVPVAFAAAAAVGMAMEATVIRHLYRRPLMTLLATWAISLFLVNLVQVLFGTQNLEFVTPAFLAGGTRVVADFMVTWNRLFAIAFAVGILALALLVLHRTPLGLFVRAVTENRDMAECVGVSTRRIDLLSFGVGSGLAGLAGLALTPIYNVNPTMGTNFIVDSFLVVVLGGVGNLAGTLIAALGIGQINIVIEPLYGAVAAKVIVLLMIILFIQFRPEGIFSVKGRR